MKNTSSRVILSEDRAHDVGMEQETTEKLSILQHFQILNMGTAVPKYV